MCWIIFNSNGIVVAATVNDTTKDMMLMERPGWTAEEIQLI